MSAEIGEESTPLERCDVVDEFGNCTGRIVVRGTELGPGEFYPVVHVWIRDEAGNYLIQQRAWTEVSGPGMWGTTAGYVQAGEDSLAGAIREAKEEMGIQLSPTLLKRLGRVQIADLIADLWLAVVSRRSIGEPVLGPEVADWMWVSKTELERRVCRGEFFAYSNISDLPG